MSIDAGVSDLLEGGTKGYNWGKRPEVGTIHRLKIESARKVQRTDYDTKKPLFYDDGNPIMQLAVTGATEERDPTVPGDDGTRTEYFHGQKLQALREALKVAGKTLEVDGELAVKLIEIKPLDGGRKEQNIFQVGYKAPVAAAIDEELF